MNDKNPKFERRAAQAGHVRDVVTRAQQASPITDSRERLSRPDASLRKLGGGNIL